MSNLCPVVNCYRKLASGGWDGGDESHNHTEFTGRIETNIDFYINIRQLQLARWRLTGVNLDSAANITTKLNDQIIPSLKQITGAAREVWNHLIRHLNIYRVLRGQMEVVAAECAEFDLQLMARVCRAPAKYTLLRIGDRKAEPKGVDDIAGWLHTMRDLDEWARQIMINEVGGQSMGLEEVERLGRDCEPFVDSGAVADIEAAVERELMLAARVKKMELFYLACSAALTRLSRIMLEYILTCPK